MCNFFDSDTWDLQCWETVQQEWTIEKVLEVVDDLQLENEERGEEVDSNQKLGVFLADNDETLPVDRETVIDAWREYQELPRSCPYEDYTETRCIFHAPHSTKDPEEVSDAFREVIQEWENIGKTKQFVGARFPHLSLRHGELDAPDNFPIDLRYAEFEQGIDLTDTVVSHPIYFDWAIFKDNADFLRAEFTDMCTFEGTEFTCFANFNWTKFRGKLELDYAQFHEPVEFTAGTFDGDCDFLGVMFEDDVEFKWVDFHGYPNFEGTNFRGEADFGGVTFYDDAGFSDTAFNGELLFRTDFGGFSEYEAHITGVADFRNSVFTDRTVFGAVFGGPATFENTTFREPSNFSEATFEDRAQFSQAKFTESADFSRSEFNDRVDFTEVGPVSDVELHIDFSEAVIPAGSFVQPSSGTTYYNLTRATVGDIKIAQPEQKDLEEPLFDIFQFSRTEFNRFDFTEYKRELSPDWTIHQTSSATNEIDGDPSEWEATYLKAKNGAKDIGDGKAAAEFFLKEMHYRRQKHWEKMTSSDTDSSRGLSAIKWCSNWLYNISCGYGERPLRTFGISLLTIALFASLYAVIEAKIDIAESLEFSFQSFVAFIVGSSPADVGHVTSLVASFEAFLGAFLIALFVFTLTRSLHR